MSKIPIVDLKSIARTPWNTSETDKWNELGVQFTNALHQFGFVYVKNHGISSEIIQSCFDASKKFFEQPAEQKEKFKLTRSPRGYHEQGYSINNTDGTKTEIEVRESFDLTGKMKLSSEANQLEQDFHENLCIMQSACLPVLKVLLRLLALGLNPKDPEYFIKSCSWLDGSETASFRTFRSLYYPTLDLNMDIPPGYARVKEHSDFDFITLLFQDNVGGLEAKAKTGEWIPVPPLENTAVVNIGDLLESWTQGYFPATKHRVIIPEGDAKRISRQSIAYFFHPDAKTFIQPIRNSVIGEYDFQPFYAYEHTKERMSRIRSY